MTAEDKLSELEINLCDKRKETHNFNQEIDEVKDKHPAMETQMEELRNENGDLEEEACGLFDKVYTTY